MDVRVRGGRALSAGRGMRQSELDALTARHARNVKVFGLWLWLFIFPVVGLIWYFCILAPGYHPAPREQPHPITCAQINAEPDPLDAGGQIAPLCGKTTYPDAPQEDGG